jgi:predicted secreted hydrolase
MTLILTPTVPDQELMTTRSTGVTYWEGSVKIQGTRQGKPITGKGYVELTGYAESLRKKF